MLDNTSNIIDSRDIIDRLEELEDEIQDTSNQDIIDEYRILKTLAEESLPSSDWKYGKTLIHEDYFTKYIEELIDDCYEIPQEIHNSLWPWRHITIDYESAAEEAKQDYFTVDFDGETYYIRS